MRVGGRLRSGARWPIDGKSRGPSPRANLFPVMSTAIATALASSFAWILRRLVLGLLVASSLSGMADMPPGTERREMPPAQRASAAVQPAGAARDDQVLRVAAAASAAHGLHGPGLAGGDARSLPAEPSAPLLVIAGLLAIVFITTRRRKDR